MSFISVTSVGRLAGILIAMATTAVTVSYTEAQGPSSASPHGQSQSDVRTVSASQAGGDQGSDKPLSLTEDGWHTWKVDAVEDAPSWCCNAWRTKEAVSASCELDNRMKGYSRQSEDLVADEIQIYVKLADGQIESLRTYDAACRVSSQSNIEDHGKVTSSASLDWLSIQPGSSTRLTGDILAAIAAHDSDRAQRLLNKAAQPDRSTEGRKSAIFWMGQVRAQQSVGELTRLMIQDDTPEIREHAVFSVSQSNLTDKLALIERVARSDGAPKVRGQAWFWIAQTADPQAGGLILAGLQTERSRSVLKAAVFALSQLPAEHAVDALIRVIERPDYDRELRKQAMFWMAQSDSRRAEDYLAEVFGR